MNEFTIELNLLSDCLVGSSEGFGAIIDTDIVFDEIGIPYIPAKRLKGLFKDSASELLEYLGDKISIDIDRLFGKTGSQTNGLLCFPNLYIKEYEENFRYLTYFIENNSRDRLNITKEKILNYFTSIRNRTAIEDGISKEHSLRKLRVLSCHESFFGNILLDKCDANIFALICQNVRYIGSNRNRGLGEVQINLMFNQTNFNKIALTEIKEKLNAKI